MPIEPGSLSLGVVAGGLIVGLANNFLTKSRNTEERRIMIFNNAAAKFQSSFVDFIYDINHTKITDGDQGWYTVRKKINTGEFFKSHEKAKILFEFHIPAKDREGFRKAWIGYSQWTDNFPNQNDNEDKRPEILGHINALLKYAEPK